MKPQPDLSLVQILRQVALDLLFAVVILLHAAGRWTVCQVLARLLYVVLLCFAALVLTDSEKGEPQPSTELEESPY